MLEGDARCVAELAAADYLRVGLVVVRLLLLRRQFLKAAAAKLNLAVSLSKVLALERWRLARL